MEPHRSLHSLSVILCCSDVKTSFYNQTYENLKALLLSKGFKPKVANDLFNWHYKKGHYKPCELKISNKSKDFIYKNFCFETLPIVTANQSEDKTVKFLMKLFQSDNTAKNLVPDYIESVLIPFQGKYSLCVSSQVGCAMNCSFCFTGTQGLKRHLKTEEIVSQVLSVKKWLAKNRPNDNRISNIVFMGQGEPLHNFDSVSRACQIFLSQHGLSIGPQKITISTSGYLPGLKQWKQSKLTVNLALSLHSTNNETRSQLIPINRAYPLAEVLNLIDTIPRHPKQFNTYEYLLISGVNDTIQDADSLGKLLVDKKALINLIPFNPFPGSKYKRPEEKSILNFKKTLDLFKIPTMIRTTKGEAVLAACGQLNSSNKIV